MIRRETTRDKIVHFVTEYARQNHNAPSTRQIATAIGVSQNRVVGCIEKLEDEHRIQRIDGRLKVVGATYTPPDEI